MLRCSNVVTIELDSFAKCLIAQYLKVCPMTCHPKMERIEYHTQEDFDRFFQSYTNISSLTTTPIGRNAFKKTGCDFGCDFCPFLSTFVHSYEQQRPPKLEAFVLKILNLALYAKRDSNPQLLAPEANALSS